MAINAYQCLLLVPICAAYQCSLISASLSVQTISTNQCPSVPPINAHQCHLSMLPISDHQCRLSMPISAAYQ
ncbi:unnamed protein product [Staurois parvus]|uniref:Secreted protein n=1 Tax=Staurois parvus TaxID=386267 RepID=A0ABN9AWX9_9NEOB|nr:unnamed protein product [Staurois parvus]